MSLLSEGLWFLEPICLSCTCGVFNRETCTISPQPLFPGKSPFTRLLVPASQPVTLKYRLVMPGYRALVDQKVDSSHQRG
jgi:hypothetical protein